METNYQEPSKKKLMLCYIIICLILTGLSFLSFLFSEWVLPICTLICSIFGSIVFFLLIKSRDSITPESGKGKFLVFMGARYALMIAGIVISCVIVRLTMNDPIDPKRYLIAVIAAVPYVATVVPWLLIKN